MSAVLSWKIMWGFYNKRVTLSMNVCCEKPVFRKINHFNVGIKHGFPYINICQVLREVLKTEVEDRGFLILPEGPGKC